MRISNDPQSGIDNDEQARKEKRQRYFVDCVAIAELQCEAEVRHLYFGWPRNSHGENDGWQDVANRGMAHCDSSYFEQRCRQNENGTSMSNVEALCELKVWAHV